MEIIRLDVATRKAFAPLLTEEYLYQLDTQQEVLAFGAVVDNAPCGVLVFALEARQVRVLWLCTAEHMREQGVARALVRALVKKAAADPQSHRLVADVPRGGRLDPTYLLLLTEGWMGVPFELPSYSFTVQQAAEQDFWKKEMNTAGVQPLAEMPATMIRAYSALLEEHAAGEPVPLPLRAKDYDPALSLGYVNDGRLCAVVLFTREDGELVLRYAQAQPDAPLALAKLVYAAGKRAIAQETPETRVSVAAVNQVGQRLIEKLLPYCTAQPMFRMIFRLPTLKEESDDV